MRYSEKQLKEILDIQERLIDYGHNLYGILNMPSRGIRDRQKVIDEVHSVLDRAEEYHHLKTKADIVSRILRESGIEEKVKD